MFTLFQQPSRIDPHTHTTPGCPQVHPPTGLAHRSIALKPSQDTNTMLLSRSRVACISQRPSVRVPCRSSHTCTAAAVKARERSSSLQQCSADVQPLTQAASSGSPALAATFALYLLSAAPAVADVADAAGSTPFQGVTANSLYVTLALFLMTAPGIWSQIKRAPTATKKRITFEVPGPSVASSMPLDARARQIFSYFKKYNYQVKETGEVITFEGIYAADRGQAAAVTFYTFAGMASVALVLSILVPSVGKWWYLLTLLSPAAWVYYFQKGERVEQFRVKMVTADDDSVTDIVVEGDKEEIERLSKELALVEKGKVRVKGILEA